MSTINNTSVNPERLEMLMTALFGRRQALNIMSNNGALKEYSLKRIEEVYGRPATRETIGKPEFQVTELALDTKGFAEAFGFNKEILIGGSDSEIFEKVLDTIDAILSMALVVPMDKMEDVKSGIKMVCQTIQKYLPDAKSIGKILSLAPGISKYSKTIVSFGEDIDYAIDIINRGGEGCIRKAINKIRSGLAKMHDVDISDINKQVKEIKNADDVVDTDFVEVKSDSKTKSEKAAKAKKDSTSNSNSRDKKEESEMDEQAVTFQQQGFIPAFLDTTIMNQGADKHVPEFIAQTMHPQQQMQENIYQQIFQPVTQQNTAIDPRLMGYPFVKEIQAIANRNGYMIIPELIVDRANNPVLIFIRTFNDKSYLYDKSFIIDLGTVIDRRYGIWPCASPEGTYYYLETCNKAYALMTRDNKLNENLIEKIIKFGFSTINVSKEDILYGERMTITNGRISLISLPNNVDKTTRNIVKGACIRAATVLDPVVGKLKLKDFNPNTLEFTLTNEGVPTYYMTQLYPQVKAEIKFTPMKDEAGKYIPVNPNGGVDIKYTLDIKYQG